MLGRNLADEKAVGEAREIAKSFLVYLTRNPERLGRFLAVTGVGPADIRARMEEDAFLGGLLDYLLGDEAVLVEFCEEEDMEPERPAALRSRLPGYQPEM